MVIGVQPVRARCGYRLCLTKLLDVGPNNDTSHLDLAAAASAPRSSQATDRQARQMTSCHKPKPLLQDRPLL